ncbi:MAG: hypothetical protein MJ154_00005 [Candidatus Saccharibacteria bacterium]|nr:hypothetical protein [Candidatus Saccharibacteria bacterium]
MYLSDGAKLCIKQILMLWDELGHEPSFSEFDKDERTPKANSLAFYFGSYSDAVAASRSFYNNQERRKELEPKASTTTPYAMLPKGKGKSKKKSPKTAIQSALTSSITPKVQQASETQVPQEKPLKEPQEASKPPIIPVQLEELEVETTEKEKLPEPVKTVPLSQNHSKEVVSMNQTIVNYLKRKVALVSSEQFNKAMAGITPEETEIIESNGIAITMKAEVHVDDFVYGDSKDLPIVSIFSRPAIVKNSAVYDFPDEKDDTLYLVEREVAEAARDLGRSTDDLVFPIEVIKLNNILYCRKLGKL